MTQHNWDFESARRLTNKQLSTEIAALVPINRDKLQELLPKKRDKEELVKLMEVVENETDMDKKLAYLQDHLQTVGKTIFKVLQIFLRNK